MLFFSKDTLALFITEEWDDNHAITIERRGASYVVTPDAIIKEG